MSDATRNKVRQLYSFLKASNQIQTRPIREVKEHLRAVDLTDIPKHVSLQLLRPSLLEEGEVSDVLFKIRRPFVTRCPEPSPVFKEWLKEGWDNPSVEAEYVEKSEEVFKAPFKEESFKSNLDRAGEWSQWMKIRKIWSDSEKIIRKALEVFEKFYDIYALIEKDGEQIELMMADGMLSWMTESSVDGLVAVYHPILSKRVDLKFDPSIPEFTIYEADRDTELYTNIFADMDTVDHVALQALMGEVSATGLHPLGWKDTDDFLKKLVRTLSPTNGMFLEKKPEEILPSVAPKVWRSPMLLLRNRTLGMSQVLDSILEDIDGEAPNVLPSALAQITGTEGVWGGTHVDSTGFVPYENDDNILLSKESNKAQRQIVQRLDSGHSVLVQGPPGTGKTHTISNVIGHLLSQGKSVLVTAQTSKALRVLRDKIPELLQPLCVSVLGGDLESKKQLEASVGMIASRLASDSAQGLLSKAIAFEQERKNLLTQEKELTNVLRQSIENEYRDIWIGSNRYTPSDAARFIASKDAVTWMKGPVVLGDDIPLSQDDLVKLFKINTLGSQEDFEAADQDLIDLTVMYSCQDFRNKIERIKTIKNKMTVEAYNYKKWWNDDKINIAELQSLILDAELIFNEALDGASVSWQHFAMVAGLRGGESSKIWLKLLDVIDKTAGSSAKYMNVMHLEPVLFKSKTHSLGMQRTLAIEICKFLDRGGKLNFIQLALHPSWKKWINAVSVQGEKPTLRVHFESLGRLARLKMLRASLSQIWDSLIGKRGGLQFAEMGEEPEFMCKGFSEKIRDCVAWNAKVWGPIEKRIKDSGFLWDAFIKQESTPMSPILEYEKIKNGVKGSLKAAVAEKCLEIEKVSLEDSLKQLKSQCCNISNGPSALFKSKGFSPVIERLCQAIDLLDVEAYEDAYSYVEKIHSLKKVVSLRSDLLNRLRMSAPGWVEQIEQSSVGTDLPEDYKEAWLFRQFSEELALRDTLNAKDIQINLDRVKNEIVPITQALIEVKAWGMQLERLQRDPSIRQSLVGWLDTTKRLSSVRQVSRRQTLLVESRRLMKRCTAAVPVWIMPIPLVAENFSPKDTQFDVVIIDEASQADLNAMIPIYMGKQVMIVGDHEQVTPLGVGKNQSVLDNLRKSMLKDIPNAHLFDSMSSIYDIGRQSLGGAVCLVEHFRCVPEIISFSNSLSYGGNILPLRDSDSTNIKPACVACKVDGFRDGDENKMEARKIVDTIKAMMRHDAYKGKTFGVISMMGNSQSTLIQTMIHKEISSVDVKERRILSGTSSDFQGDERDIIFLSMIESPEEEGVLRMVGEGAFELNKKRYNVAVSRARDQLWVMHSFDPDLHLKMNDLRFKLFQHIKDPLAWLKSKQRETEKTESPFELDVFNRLTERGFSVRSQWQVGHFRIDMVVEEDGKRLAIECDGDRWHPTEQLLEDMHRQSILERLGWKFVRIRGSAFYRNKDRSMEQIFSQLDELGIIASGIGNNTERWPVADTSILDGIMKMVEQGVPERRSASRD